MTEVITGTLFRWNSRAHQAFEKNKSKLTQVPVLALLCFEEMFEVKSDASRVVVGGILTQEGRHFSKKLSDSKRKYSTYDKEFMPSSDTYNIEDTI